MTELVSLAVNAALAYGLLGVLFAGFFVTRGAKALDPDAVAGTWGFKVLIFPGTAALWPLLLVRWMRAGRRP